MFKKKLFHKVKTNLLIRLLSTFHADQRVFLNSIGLSDQEVNLGIGLETNYLIAYHPEMDCVLPRLIKAKYGQLDGKTNSFINEEVLNLDLFKS